MVDAIIPVVAGVVPVAGVVLVVVDDDAALVVPTRPFLVVLAVSFLDQRLPRGSGRSNCNSGTAGP